MNIATGGATPHRVIELVILLSALAGSSALFVLAGPCPEARAGVHFDPESPAGKEYGLPLPEARNEALGGGSGDRSGAPPLFGVGVGPRPKASTAGTGPGSGGGRGASRPPRRRSAAHPGSEAVPARAAGTPAAAGGSAARSYPLTGGLAIAIGLLVLACLLGFGLRVLAGPRPAGPD